MHANMRRNFSSRVGEIARRVSNEPTGCANARPNGAFQGECEGIENSWIERREIGWRDGGCGSLTDFAWTAWKYEMRDRGYKLPTEFADGRSQCFCGAALDIR
ncbi:MAG: hypothetical protein KGL62_16780, partial [Bradyrhizobium sp.]|nr:hypothetical protein [Bradyrhizobium sp.]